MLVSQDKVFLKHSVIRFYLLAGIVFGGTPRQLVQ